MKARFLVFAALASTAATALLAQDTQVGLVVRAAGEGSLVRQGSPRALKLAEALFAGDQIRVDSGETSFLFCPSGELVTLAAGSDIVLSETGYEARQGPPPAAQGGRKCTLPKVALGAESLERVGGLRARGFPPIVVYLGGQVSTVRPVFSWEPVGGTVGYEIRIKDPRGKLLLEGTATGTQWQPPEDLPPGSYQWEILAQGTSETVAQQLARFVVTPAEVETAPGEDVADLLVNATLYENAGYYAEAAHFYRQLRVHYPEDERLTGRLAWLYWNSGLIAASNLENERLRGASRPD